MGLENAAMLLFMLAALIFFKKKIGSEQIYKYLFIGLAAALCILALVEFMKA